MQKGFKILILRKWMFSLHACLYTMYVPGIHRDQNGMLDSLELMLQTIVSLHVELGTKVGLSARAASTLYL